MDLELQTIKTNGNDDPAYKQVVADDVDGMARRTPGGTERDTLLSEQITVSNGEPSDHVVDPQRNMETTNTSGEESTVCRIKKEMNQVIFWKVRLWIAIIFIFFVIIAVIIISLVICSAIHEDEDEKFDRSLFEVPQYFNGSFQLPNLPFTEEKLALSSDEIQKLTAALEGKLDDLYRSSPALGRYFSKANIYVFRNDSVITDYQLTFLMPEEEQGQLRKFTLSREMVYNVFRQFLYDQDPNESGPMYIDPHSLNMFRRH